MNTDFDAAHCRHWDDAEFLFDNERTPNADHLYGVSAECGLKAVMGALGMEVDARGDPSSKDHKLHVDKLWAAFRTLPVAVSRLIMWKL